MSLVDFLVAMAWGLLTVLVVVGVAARILGQEFTVRSERRLVVMVGAWALALLGPVFPYPVGLWVFTVLTVVGWVAALTWVVGSAVDAHRARRAVGPVIYRAVDEQGSI